MGGRRGRSVIERLFDRIEPQVDGCWHWTGFVNAGGYGQFTVDRVRSGHAHRLVYEELVGPIPDGLHLDHLCRVKRCVNPEHLEPVTQAENNRRQIHTSNHCKRGHEFTTENTYLYVNRLGNRVRICKACNVIRKQRAA